MVADPAAPLAGKPRLRLHVLRTPLAWYDNVPLLSFALLRGRCRHCKAAIPWRYPLVEATTRSSWPLRAPVRAYLDAAVGAFFCAALVAISATDVSGT